MRGPMHLYLLVHFVSSFHCTSNHDFNINNIIAKVI
jgi:hypothetical protein